MIYLYFNFQTDMGLFNFVIFIYNHLVKDYKVKIIFNLNEINLQNDIVICSSVETQAEFFFKKNNSTVYTMLDDKVEFYKYFSYNQDLLENKNIKLIPIYTKNYTGENIHKEFIIKHKNGLGSAGNKIEKDQIYNIIKKYDNDDYQIQDILETKYIYGVNCSCINGEIKGVFTFLKKPTNKLLPYMLGEDEDRKCANFIKYKNIDTFIKNIIKRLNYNGLVEFEFLQDINDQFYLMECNPRITHSIFTKFYYDNIIVPYINNQTNSISIPSEINIHYHGNLIEILNVYLLPFVKV